MGVFSAATITGTTVASPQLHSYSKAIEIYWMMGLGYLEVQATITQAWSNVNLPNGRIPTYMGNVALKTAEGAYNTVPIW